MCLHVRYANPFALFAIALAVCLAFSIAARAQTAPQGFVPDSSGAARPEQSVRDSKLVDQFIPVITMEQFYSGSTRLQGYRIQIFMDGTGIYHGLKHVKTLGEVRFYIKPEQVQKILGEFERLKFWRVPEDQYGMPKGLAPLMLLFTLRGGVVSKTVRFSGQNHGAMLRKIIEDEVQSARWRCPYVDDRNIELCASQDRLSNYSIPEFLNFDLPKILDTYK